MDGRTDGLAGGSASHTPARFSRPFFPFPELCVCGRPRKGCEGYFLLPLHHPTLERFSVVCTRRAEKNYKNSPFGRNFSTFNEFASFASRSASQLPLPTPSRPLSKPSTAIEAWEKQKFPFQSRTPFCRNHLTTSTPVFSSSAPLSRPRSGSQQESLPRPWSPERHFQYISLRLAGEREEIKCEKAFFKRGCESRTRSSQRLPAALREARSGSEREAYFAARLLRVWKRI
jgi:hypothetical protein